MSPDCLTEEILVDLASQMWSSLLPDGDALEATPLGLQRLVGATAVVATVEISGGEPVAVDLACSARLARRVAASMFALAESDVVEHEVFDAVGELANIVGGNVKSLLSGERVLSLPVPRVVAGVASAHGERCAAGFVWREEALAVFVRISPPTVSAANAELAIGRTQKNLYGTAAPEVEPIL